MIRLWDGILSGLAAILTIALVGVPLWAAVTAVQGALVPGWTWGAIVGLGFVGILMTLSFLRKAISGIHPTRERRR